MIGICDIDKMNKGNVTTAHSAIAATATSAKIDCRGYNALLVLVDLGATGTPNWTITFTGSPTEQGTYAAIYKHKDDGTLVAVSSGALTADTCFVITGGLPDNVKVVATENSGTGTCTVTVQPCNI